MTKVKTAKSITRVDGKNVEQQIQYYEVSIKDVNNMLRGVGKGGDEDELRQKMLTESKW